jgi:hypothetical protein
MLVLSLSAVSETQTLLRFCDLLENPEKYNGREVTVRATYQYGYEWNYLYCLGCEKRGRVWLEMPAYFEDRRTEVELSKAPDGAGIVNVTVTGTFAYGSTYGHLNGYRYQLSVTKLRNLVVLQKGMQSAEKERKTEEKWACGGKRPR